MLKFNWKNLILLLFLCTSVYAEEEIIFQNPIEVIEPEKQDISKPLREMRPALSPARKSQHLVPLHKMTLIPSSPLAIADSTLQTAAASFLLPTITHNFLGIGEGLGGYTPNSAPPDTNGAPGLTQYVQWVNTDLAVFNKTNGSLIYGPVPGNTLWQGFGGLCETSNDGDPIVKYDQIANRWVMTQFAFSNSFLPPFYQCIAVSTTSDATGPYYRYAYRFNNFNDYTKLGVWSSSYLFSTNMFDQWDNYLGPKVCALRRSSLLSGQKSPLQCFQLPPSFNTVLPSDLDGQRLPPAGTPGYFLGFTNSKVFYLYKFKINWNRPARSTLSAYPIRGIAPFVQACGPYASACIPQPNTSNVLEALGDRLMYRLAYRQFPNAGVLLANHSIRTTGVSGIRWYQININNKTQIPNLVQQGTYAPTTSSRFMGSIAMDKVANIAVGYSVSSRSLFPSIAIATRTKTDPKGKLGAEQILVTGAGSQNGGLDRWGDYSSMAIDPVDDCTFWYTNQFLPYTGNYNWSTQIIAFKHSNCS